jgi:Asp-tRNA(Asn)/Glu-tRNA(Gln) amidotransferase A subunit family amidase
MTDQAGAHLTASQALGRIRAGDLSAEALTRACLSRIAERDPQVWAWTTVQPDIAIAQAMATDQSGAAKPLGGLPIGIKDVILTHDLPTQYNSPIYQGFHPRLDAACVTLLRAAGAVILGKTDTVEFAAIGRKAATRNPHDLARTPGASSSGSAAAVADFHVPLALGTQTGGSMIRPASYCGVWAIKPTWGLVGTEGARRFAASLDTIGWFARAAEDLALLYDVFDPDPAPPATRLEIEGARIALCHTPAWPEAEPAAREAMAEAARRLVARGAIVSDLDLPAAFDGLAEAQSLIMRAEGRAAFLPEYRAHGAALEETLRLMVENVEGRSRADLVGAYDLAARCRQAFDEIAGPYDAILAPSAAGEAPVGLAFTGSFAFNGLWTLLHVPCVNVPGFTGPAGLPVGLTVLGPRFADRQVLAAAAALGEVFRA